VSIAVLGVVLDALIWCLPHYVVWHLRLRLSHKVAVSAMFAFGLLCDQASSVLVKANMFSNMFIGALRVDSLADVAYTGDVTYGIGTTLMWALAQISTGIIVACLPHLRPLFDCILPRRLIHLSTRRSKTQSKASLVSQQAPSVLIPPRIQSRAGSITVTTKIAVERAGHFQPPLPPPIDIHDGQLDPDGPVFHVEQGPAKRSGLLAHCCGGSSRGCGCLC
jgi:hypothetical protein